MVAILFRLKICGIRRSADVALVAAAGGDAVGLNFHPPSVRYLPPAAAAELSALAAGRQLTRVGVFVDQTPQQIDAIARQTDLDWVQLHGLQTLDDARWLVRHGHRVIQVVRLPVGPLAVDQIERLVAPWRAAGINTLLDADVGAAAGGMGVRLDWAAIGRWWRTIGPPQPQQPAPLPVSRSDQQRPPDDWTAAAPPVAATPWSWALAGGLSAETVGEAIAQSAAMAVDVASGVEQPRGVKSGQRIKRFIAAAQAAWPTTD